MDQVAYSWLSGRTGQATENDIAAVRHFAAYAHTTRAVGVTYHRRGEGEPVSPQVVVAPDAAYRRHPCGRSQLGVGVWLGAVDSPSGFIDWISRKERGAPSLSVPEAELKAHVEGTKMAIDHRTTSQELGDEQLGPTVILEDNDTVRNNIMELTGKPSAMRHAAQLTNFCTHHVNAGTTTTVRVAGRHQPGDGMTKLFGPTEHWRAAESSMGWSRPLEEMRRRVRILYGRKGTESEREQAEADSEYEQMHGGNPTLTAWQVGIERIDEAHEEEALDDDEFEQERGRVSRAREGVANASREHNGRSHVGDFIRQRIAQHKAEGICLPQISIESIHDCIAHGQRYERCKRKCTM
jgi:hypothetical protein